MANEVEVVIKGRSEGLTGVMNSVRTQMKQGMQRVKTETSRDGKAIGQGIGDSIKDGLQSTSRPITAAYARIRSTLKDIRVKVNFDQGGAFKGIKDKLKVDIDIDRDKFMNNIKDTMTAMRDRVKDGFKEAFQKGASAVGNIGLMPILLAALIPIVTGLAGLLGTMIGAALVLGFGAAFVSFGVGVLMESKKLKKEVQKDWDAVGDSMKRAFKPLEPVILAFTDKVREIAKFFEPTIKAMAKMAAPALIKFIDELGVAFKELEPAMEPMMKAFTDVLGELGPMLPGMFKSIAGSLSEFAQTVSENKTMLTGVFALIIKAIPVVLDSIGGLIRFMSFLVVTMTGAFSDIAVTAADWAHGILGALASVAEALAQMPGPWQETMAAAGQAMRRAQEDVLKYREEVQKMPKSVKLQVEIDELTAKLELAKSKLKDPELSKKRKAEINAEISDLLNRVTIAKNSLNSIQDKTVRVTVVTTHQGGGKAIVTGGNVGASFASFSSGGNSGGKGVSGPGATTALVGERGPEMLRLPTGSSVLPNSAVRTTQTASAVALARAVSTISDVVTKMAQQIVGSSKSVAASIAKIPDILYKMDPREANNSGVTIVDLDNPSNSRLPGSNLLQSSGLIAGSGPSSPGGSGGARPSYEVQIQITGGGSSGSRISDAILEDLRESVRTRGGDVQQVIGGKGLRR